MHATPPREALSLRPRRMAKVCAVPPDTTTDGAVTVDARVNVKLAVEAVPSHEVTVTLSV